MPHKSLLIINRIVVSFFAIVLFDMLTGGNLKQLLPTSVSNIAWYYYIFGLPHIIASFFSYADKEYFNFYKKKIINSAIFFSIAILTLLLFLPNLFFYVFIGYTMYHVAWQQIGLCRKWVQNKTLFTVWSTSGVTAIIALTLSIGGEGAVVVPPVLFVVLQTIGVFSLLVFMGVSTRLLQLSEYVTTTIITMLFSAIAIFTGYFIIGILMVRIAHDVSAFSIYVAHDRKFQERTSSNYLYNFLGAKPDMIMYVLPMVSLFIVFMLHYLPNFIFIFILFVMSSMHYYLESFIWKRGALHRETLG